MKRTASLLLVMLATPAAGATRFHPLAVPSDVPGANALANSSLNRFAYVLDNPYKYVDPSGLMALGSSWE